MKGDMTMTGILDEARHVTAEALGYARDVLRQLGPVNVHAKGSHGDVVTDHDYAAENKMIDVIRGVFPRHRIMSEEGGHVDNDPEWTWLIDPVDGTNNLALGLPLTGSCVTLLHDGEPVVAGLYVTHEDVVYTAALGQGATRDGEPVRVSYGGPPELAAVSWINGYPVRGDDPEVMRARALLGRGFRRTLTLWAPSADWSLLLQGRTAALVAYKNEPDDLLGGMLIAAEAGAAVTRFDGEPPAGDYDRVIVAAPETAAYIQGLLG
jgi:myo-inositol-1(or 4)-monophosphatase